MDRDEPDDDVASSSFSFADGRSSSVSVTVSQLATDRDAYKSSKSCTSCDTLFGSFGITTAKKYICRFCYTGVCSKCSPHRVIHPEARRKERCCVACYSKFVADTVRAGMEVDITRRASEADTLLKRYEEEKKAQEAELAQNAKLTNELETLKSEVSRVKLEQETMLDKKMNLEKQKREELQTLIQEKNRVSGLIQGNLTEIEKVKSERILLRKNMKTDAAKLSELERLLREVESDMKEVVVELNTDQAPIPVSEDTKSARVTELQRNIESDRELLIRLQQENIALTKEMMEKKGRTGSLRYSRQEREMTDLGEVVRSGSDQLDIQEIQRRIKQLAAEIEQLKQSTPSDSQEILELRSALSQEKEENKSLMLQFQDSLLSERTADPVGENCCRCHLM